MGIDGSSNFNHQIKNPTQNEVTMNRQLSFTEGKKGIALIGVLSISLLLAGCGGSSDKAEGGADSSSAASGAGGELCAAGAITLGSAKALSGGFSFYDTAGSHAEELAVETINEQGGINGCPVKLVTQDTKSDPAVGRQVAQELIRGGAQVLLPPNDVGVGTPAALEAQSQGIFSNAGASGDDYAPSVGDLFATGGSMASLNGRTAAAFAKDQGYDSVYYVVNDAFTYFTVQEDYFREDVGDSLKELGRSVVTPGQTDFAAVISDIKRSIEAGQKPMILGATMYPDAPTFVAQLRKAGVDAPVVGNASWATRNIVDALGGSTNNVFYTAGAYTEGDDVSPEAKAYVEKYNAKYGTYPENHQAVESYWSIWALFKAIEAANSTDGAAIQDALFAQKDLELPLRTVYSWKDGHILGSNVVVGFTPTGAFEEVKSYKLTDEG